MSDPVDIPPFDPTGAGPAIRETGHMLDRAQQWRGMRAKSKTEALAQAIEMARRQGAPDHVIEDMLDGYTEIAADLTLSHRRRFWRSLRRPRKRPDRRTALPAAPVQLQLPRGSSWED